MAMLWLMLIACFVTALAVFVVQFIAVIVPEIQYVFVNESDTETDRLKMGLWSVCFARREAEQSSDSSDNVDYETVMCSSLQDFNADYVKRKREMFLLDTDYGSHHLSLEDESVESLNETMSQNSTEVCWSAGGCNSASSTDDSPPTCDALSAPYVSGATFTNDTLYGSIHVYYQCVHGYQPGARYNSDVFCKCNATACWWTATPVCIPHDICLPAGPTESNICTVGNSSFVFSTALSLANPTLGIPVPDIALPIGTYIFPKMIFPCAGDIRQFDIVAATVGKICIDVWRFVKAENALMLIGSNVLQVTNTGLQGYVIDGQHEISVLKGDILGIHYDTRNSSAAALLYYYTPNNNNRSTNDCKGLESKDSAAVFCDFLKFSGSVASLKAWNKISTDHFLPPSLSDVNGSLFPSYPAVIGYVTIGGVVPGNKHAVVLQALAITSIVLSLGVMAFLVALFVLIRRYDKTADKKNLDVANATFEKCSKLFLVTILMGLSTGAASLEEYGLIFSSYNCNSFDQWHLGIAGWCLLLAGPFGLVLVILTCWTEYIFHCYITIPVDFASIAVEEAANLVSSRRRTQQQSVTSNSEAVASNSLDSTMADVVRRAELYNRHEPRNPPQHDERHHPKRHNLHRQNRQQQKVYLNVPFFHVELPAFLRNNNHPNITRALQRVKIIPSNN